MNIERYHLFLMLYNWDSLVGKRTRVKKDTRTLSSKSFKRVMPEQNPDVIPICERYTLSISEAAQYFGIGQVRLRSIIHANPNADFLLRVGNRLQIKRKKFEAFIDDMSVV